VVIRSRRVVKIRKEIKIDATKGTILAMLYFIVTVFGVAGIINADGLLFLLSMTLLFMMMFTYDLVYEFTEKPERTHLRHFESAERTLCRKQITSNIKIGNLRDEIDCDECKKILDRVIYH